MNHPEHYSDFYKEKTLGFDLYLVDKGFQKFKRYFRGENCLELGPASGYMTKELVKSFKRVVAVEGSKTLYDQIPDHSNLEKHNLLFENYSTKEKFDTIILNHVLEHIQDPVSLLIKIKEWLSSTGIFIVGVPNAKSFHRLAAVKMGLLQSEYALNERDLALGHYRIYDFELLTQDLNKAGFNVLHKGGIFLKFLSNQQIEKYLNKEIIEAYFELSDDFIENSAEIFIVATL